MIYNKPDSQAQAAQHRFALRVYYEDTDAGGVVYHSNYLRYFERARTEWLRDLGFEHHQLKELNGIGFVVRSMQIEFIRPAILDDALTVVTQLVAISAARLQFMQQLYRLDSVLCTAEAEVVTIQLTTQRACRLPTALRQPLNKQLGK